MLSNFSFVLQEMLDRKLNFDGFYKIPEILKIACDRLTSSDKTLSGYAICSFELLANNLPIYTK